MTQSSKKPKQQPIVALDPTAYRELKEMEAQQQGDLNKVEDEIQKRDVGQLGLILKSLQAFERNKTAPDRMSFEVDPNPSYQTYAGLYRDKSNLTPDHIIKKVIGPGGDELVCQILQARSNMLASFGRPRMSRFSNGFEFDDIPGADLSDDPKVKEELDKRIARAKKIFWNCGMGPAKKEYYQPNFSQYLKMITRDGCAYGRFATEVLWNRNLQSGQDEFYGFRAADAGTMYHITPDKEEDQTTRQKAIKLLQDLRNTKIDPTKYEREEYKWVQVINGIPDQAFPEKEMIIYNMYPVTNVEYNGYPLTPIDQSLNAIVTHINITIHNKLYFQHGRAARGMIIFQSDNIEESTVQKIRLQFHQSINSASNSWRMPVFGVGQDDKISWQSIDIAGRDAEFQYLMDQNARVILSAFQMSPEELPGYNHLARGTNSQSLSESDNEYKMTAARDVGLRPLISDIQDFLNTYLLPLVDPVLAKTHRITLAGLEKEGPEKEAARLQTDMGIHMTMNDVMREVEKEMLSPGLGGNLPLNSLYKQNVLDPYLTVGEILENFFGRKGAAADPRFNYVRDPFWVQYQQLLIQQAQMSIQMQMQQQQTQQQQQVAAAGQPPDDGAGSGNPPSQDETTPSGADAAQKAEVAARNLQKREQWCAQNIVALDKSIQHNSRKITQMILKRHKEIVDQQMKDWEHQSKRAIQEIEAVVQGKKS